MLCTTAINTSNTITTQTGTELKTLMFQSACGHEETDG